MNPLAVLGNNGSWNPTQVCITPSLNSLGYATKIKELLNSLESS